MDKKTPFKKNPTKENKSDNKPAKNQSSIAEHKGCFVGTIGKDKIAVRAYFISERRHQLGWDGNEESDWMEAEQQLQAEELSKA